MKILIALLLLAAPAHAIELSLEENRAERGSIGFVDIQRLFSASPDAARAKESFEELVRQAEERVNLKKAEGLKTRMELEVLKVERDALAKSTPTLPTPVAAPIPAPEPPKAPTPEKLTLPGMTPPESAPSAPPAASTAATPIVVSTPTVSAPVAISMAPEISRRLLELDGRIVGLQADLDRMEAELKRERQDADKGLLDVEGRKTDQVLARLYRAINEVARKEGVSVVVDKNTILYGHPAVNLTDKVLAHLKASTQP
ncbi:MAG: OmpH family outer membrane protein [Elusimicrobiota bacterium]